MLHFWRSKEKDQLENFGISHACYLATPDSDCAVLGHEKEEEKRKIERKEQRAVRNVSMLFQVDQWQRKGMKTTEFFSHSLIHSLKHLVRAQLWR